MDLLTMTKTSESLMSHIYIHIRIKKDRNHNDIRNWMYHSFPNKMVCNRKELMSRLSALWTIHLIGDVLFLFWTSHSSILLIQVTRTQWSRRSKATLRSWQYLWNSERYEKKWIQTKHSIQKEINVTKDESVTPSIQWILNTTTAIRLQRFYMTTRVNSLMVITISLTEVFDNNILPLQHDVSKDTDHEWKHYFHTGDIYTYIYIRQIEDLFCLNAFEIILDIHTNTICFKDHCSTPYFV